MNQSERAELRRPLREALEFLAAQQDALRRAVPNASDEEIERAYWYPREPSYSWKSAYGDFSPATLKAGVERGYINSRGGNFHGYSINAAGRAALSTPPEHGEPK